MIGRLVAGWMVERGARNLALGGRRPPDREAEAAIAALRAAGARVEVFAADVGDEAALTQVLAAVDAVFADPAHTPGLTFSGDAIRHQPHREGHAGLVEIWEPEAPTGIDAPAARVAEITAALSGFATGHGIHDIHNVRVRDTEAGQIVNFHCRAAPTMSVLLVHEAVDEIERALRRAFPTVKRVISHAEPARETTT